MSSRAQIEASLPRISTTVSAKGPPFTELGSAKSAQPALTET